MLECREYSYQELSEIFNTRDNRSIKNRLTRWNVEYTCHGRGANFKLTIQNIHDPFKVFCILELSYAPNTDFRKLAYFLYYYMNDMDFYSLPCERQEQIMRMEGMPISRQTIDTYIQRLDTEGLILRRSWNFRYYFASGDTLIDTDEKTYKQAWHEYWKDKESLSSQEAIWMMREKYGGVAKKQAIPEQNVFYVSTWDTLNAYATARVEEDADKFVSSHDSKAQEFIEE